MRGERGYLATQRPKSLALFRTSLEDVSKLSAHIRSLTRDNPAQEGRLSELNREVNVFASSARRTVALVEANNLKGAIAITKTGREREAIEASSAVLDEIKTAERRLLALREAQNTQVLARSANLTRVVLALILLLLALVGAAAAAMLRARADAWRANEELKASERLYRLMAEHSNDMVVSIGLDGVRRYVSPASKSLLGYAPDELIGNTPVAAIHIEDRARVVEVCQSLLAGATNPICAYRQQHRDGHFVWLEASYRLIRDAVRRSGRVRCKRARRKPASSCRDASGRNSGAARRQQPVIRHGCLDRQGRALASRSRARRCGLVDGGVAHAWCRRRSCSHP